MTQEIKKKQNKRTSFFFLLLLSVLFFWGLAALSQDLKNTGRRMRPVIIPPGTPLPTYPPATGDLIRFWFHERCLSADRNREKLAALTFDDGPYPFYSTLLLNILRRHQVPATFFVVGQDAETHPQLLRMIASGGNEIANHTFTHTRLEGLSEPEIRRELEATNKVLRTVLGRSTLLVRPPGGRYETKLLQTLQELGYTTVLDSNNPGDWIEEDPQKITGRVLENLRPGDVILLHSGRIGTLRALDEIIFNLKARGYRLVTVTGVKSSSLTNFTRCPSPANHQKCPSEIRRRGLRENRPAQKL